MQKNTPPGFHERELMRFTILVKLMSDGSHTLGEHEPSEGRTFSERLQVYTVGSDLPFTFTFCGNVPDVSVSEHELEASSLVIKRENTRASG